MIIYYIICLVILLSLVFNEYIKYIPIDTMFFKSIFLLFILGVSFIDIELALLLTLLFFILMIKTNKNITDSIIKKEKFETVPLNYYTPKTIENIHQSIKKKDEESLIQKVETKRDLLSPYKEYIDLLMTEKSLDIIQNNRIL